MLGIDGVAIIVYLLFLLEIWQYMINCYERNTAFRNQQLKEIDYILCSWTELLDERKITGLNSLCDNSFNWTESLPIPRGKHRRLVLKTYKEAQFQHIVNLKTSLIWHQRNQSLTKPHPRETSPKKLTVGHKATLRSVKGRPLQYQKIC